MLGRNGLDPEDGFSLIEILITVVIVGITFAALLGAAIASITASATRRDLAQADALVRDAAEWLKSPIANPYVPCARADSYGFQGFPWDTQAEGGTGYQVSIVGPVEFWDGAPPVAGVPYEPGFTTTCDAPTDDHGLQRITVRITAPGGAVEVVRVLKRDVTG
jgi:prepilin-type N-terminal cleavage/methylation domain-containing protein